MKRQDLDTITEILADLAPLDAKRRTIALNEKKIDPATREEIVRLIAAEDKAESFMSATASDFTRDFFEGEDGHEADGEALSPGEKVGAFEIVRELGAGGMGRVYLAERRDGKFNQTVALKLLRSELNTKEIREAFRREIDIQAKLVHPNIARVLDTGTTEGDVPYVVMDYIAGLPIDQYCRENSLKPVERLKLFNHACEAVAFAHNNLIVHRDLKPSNIIVTGNGEPKLLDFGIAEIVSSGQPPSSVRRAMTPEFASPERLAGQAETTSVDVFSLGVILRRLLADTARTDEDVDAIVKKATAADPDVRYQSVEQMRLDIWRHIDGLPVQARSQTFWYRSAKFLRRRKFAAAAAALVLVSIIGGSGAAIWQAGLARAEAATASAARLTAIAESQAAKAEQAKSEKISTFMAQVLSYANPSWYAPGSKYNGQVRVIDAMEDLSDKIDVEFAGQADVQAELHHKFSEVFLMAAKPRFEKDPECGSQLKERSKFHALRALDLRRSFYGDRHELVAKDIFYSYRYLGRNDEEQAVYLYDAIQMMRETNPQNLNFPYMIEAYAGRLVGFEYEEPERIAYTHAAAIRPDETRFEIADRLYGEAMPVFYRHYKTVNSAVALNECYFAFTLMHLGKWSEFDEHFGACRQGLAIELTPATIESLRKRVELIENDPLFRSRTH